jgi:hypothetical protein
MALFLLILVCEEESMETKATVISGSCLDILERDVDIELTLNDLRILLGCMRAVQYQMEIDGDDYLNRDGQALKDRLDSLYLKALSRNGSKKNGHQSLA